MKFRQKMLIMELSTAAAFVITLALFFVLLHNITMLKNIEIQSQKVFNKLISINYSTSSLVNSRFNFSERSLLWNKSIDIYTEALSELNENDYMYLVGKREIQNIEKLQKSWELLTDQTFSIFNDKIASIADRNIKSKVGKYTLKYASEYEKIIDILEYEDILILTDFINYQGYVASDMTSYTLIMDTFITNIQDIIEGRINFTFILTITLLALTIIIAMAAIIIYAGGLSRQIKTIENTTHLVTAGNFDVKLDVQTSDEFKSLSKNFNLFTEMLWSRLDAVRTIMKDMADISGEMDNTKTLKEILNLAMTNSFADAGAIFLYEEDDNLLKPVFVKGDFPPPYPLAATISQDPEKAFKHFISRNIIPGENIIGKVASTGEGIFVKNTELTDDLPARWANDPLHISSFMAIPLLISNKVLGVFALAKTEPDVYFTDLSFTNMKTFSEYTALSLDNQNKYTELKEKFELSRELSIATEIQQGLRLKKLPRYKNLKLSSYNKTARGISGDYYDIFKISQNKTAVVLCDVAGKGIPAALIMVMIRTILRVIANAGRDSGTILDILNKNISGKVGNDQYATIGIIIINHNTGELTFSNAAHLPLHVYRKENKRFDTYDTKGLPIGVAKGVMYEQKKIQLYSGDIAAICTDGLTEARNINGQEFSTQTLLREIKKIAEMPVDEISEIIGKEMDIFLRDAPLFDDQTLLLMKYEG